MIGLSKAIYCACKIKTENQNYIQCRVLEYSSCMSKTVNISNRCNDQCNNKQRKIYIASKIKIYIYRDNLTYDINRTNCS